MEWSLAQERGRKSEGRERGNSGDDLRLLISLCLDSQKTWKTETRNKTEC